MQDKLMAQLKKASFMTAHPDADWLRILIASLVLLLVSAGWSTYLYFNIQSSVAVLDSQQTIIPVHAEGSNDLKVTVSGYEDKALRYDALLNGKPVPLPDPTSS